MAIGNMVGASVRGTKTPNWSRAPGTYVDDIKLPGMLYVGIVRSPYAHARITDDQHGRGPRRDPRVKAVLTGQDVRERQKLPLPITWVIPPDLKAPDHWAMATDVVHYVGEPVAAVLVEDRYADRGRAGPGRSGVRTAAGRHRPEQALNEGAPLVHEDLGTNQAYIFTAASGDMDAAFSGAPVVVKQRMINQRLAPVSHRDARHRGPVQQAR